MQKRKNGTSGTNNTPGAVRHTVMPARVAIGTLKKKADRSLQDHFRRIKTKCEICGKPYQVAHHFITKASSNYLRYEEKNLIFICRSCHTKIHLSQDPVIIAKIVQLRGKKWLAWVESHRHLRKADKREEIMAISVYYNDY